MQQPEISIHPLIGRLQSIQAGCDKQCKCYLETDANEAQVSWCLSFMNNYS